MKWPRRREHPDVIKARTAAEAAEGDRNKVEEVARRTARARHSLADPWAGTIVEVIRGQQS